MYEFHLAERLGMTVTELRERITSEDLTLWEACDRVTSAWRNLKARAERNRHAH